MSEVLNVRKLLAMTRCVSADCESCLIERPCVSACISKCVADAARTALTYRYMLERHIWHKRSSDGKEFCIECRNLKENGHTKDCELQKLLKEG